MQMHITEPGEKDDLSLMLGLSFGFVILLLLITLILLIRFCCRYFPLYGKFYVTGKLLKYFKQYDNKTLTLHDRGEEKN